MYGIVAAGVLLGAGALLAFLESKKLRIGDTAIIPFDKVASANLNIVIPFLGLDPETVSLLVTARNGEECTGTVIGAAPGFQTPVKFHVTDVKSFARNGKVHPGGK